MKLICQLCQHIIDANTAGFLAGFADEHLHGGEHLILTVVREYPEPVMIDQRGHDRTIQHHESADCFDDPTIYWTGDE